MRVLISGASIAGPVLAYWLHRYGFEVTVVERAPALRRTGGHAVDLFRPAMDISERMGVLPQIESKVTGTTRLTACRGDRRTTVDLTKLFRAVSDRHVEIMRDDLSEIYHDATTSGVEYVFGDSITSITEHAEDVEVAFETSPPRRFDLVVGADGLHSNVRRLVFGPERDFTTFIGAYLAVLTVPNRLDLDGEFVYHLAPGRAVGMYGARHLDDARLVFLFRSDPLDYHHRDVPRQKSLLRQAFRSMHSEVDGWLEEIDRTPAFYFDSITQLNLPTWSRGRVTLVGDAGYCPGPAVGGSTSLAVLGAYVLAGELAAAGGDHERAFAAYERELATLVARSRAFAVGAARSLIPNSRAGVWALVNGARLISALPTAVGRTLARLNSRGLRLHDTMPVRDYPVRYTGSSAAELEKNDGTGGSVAGSAASRTSG